MNKKSQTRLIKGIIIGILLISIFSFVFVLAEEESTITNSGNPMLISVGEKSLINYKFDWGQTNITLYKAIPHITIEKETKYNYTIFNDIYVEAREKGWKFGASDASLTKSENARYKYILNSTDKLILLYKEGFDEKENFTYKYPILYNYHSNPKNEWNEYRHIYNFKDICSKKYSNCEWLWYGDSIEISFTSDKNIDPSIINVSWCQTLYKDNQTYQLNKSLKTLGDCIVVTGYNITFDLKGYNITRDDDVGEDYGIDAQGGGLSDYLTIKNGYVYNFERGINLGSSDYITIKNMTANNNSYGIYLNSSSNDVLTDIIINNNSNGIYLRSSPNNVLTNITANSNDYGVYLISSPNNIIQNTTVNLNRKPNAPYNGVGIFLRASSNNNLINILAESNDYGIVLSSSSNNNIIDSNISNSRTREVYLYHSINNIFLNVTYNISLEYVYDSKLIRKWYYKAKVNNTIGDDVNRAKVNAYNRTDNLVLSLTTNSNGWTELGELIDYINNDGTKTYYSNYTINASHPCYKTEPSHTYNITNKTNIYKDVFTLGDFLPCVFLNEPKNSSNITGNYAILNWTIEHPADEQMEVWVYGSNDTSNFGTSWLYHRKGLPQDIYTYNWSGIPVQPDDDTVLLFHFDNRSDKGENDTHVYDFSGNQNNATCSGTKCPKWNETGKFAGAFEFDGEDDNFIVSHSPELTLNNPNTGFTITAWINRNTMPSNGGTVIHKGTSQNRNYRITIENDNRINFFWEVSGGANRNTISTGTINTGWQHLAVVWNGTYNLIYINGVLDIFELESGVPTTSTNDVEIGYDSTNADGYFNGTIDEFTIWNRTLSLEEISFLAKSPGRHYWQVNVSNGTKSSISDVWEFNLIKPDNPPSVTLDFPPNGVTLNYTTIDFNFTATDDHNLTNATLYFCNVTAGGCDSNGFTTNKTITISGESNSTNITVTMIDNQTYWWNIYVCDNSSQCAFATNNFTLYVNTSYVAPVVYPIFGVLHSIHTTISDGVMSPSQRVETLKNNYDWAATVDHDNHPNFNWNALKSEANGNNTDNKFTYFAGYEWTISIGHRVVFYMDDGPNSVCETDQGCNTIPLLTNHLQTYNGLATHNHPARGAIIDWSDTGNRNDTYIPLVEMVNKGEYFWNDHWNFSDGSSYPNPSPPGSPDWRGAIKKALDLGYHLGFVAGWDYHRGTMVPMYTGLVSPPNFTRSGVFETLKKRHTWAAQEKIFMNVTAYNGSDTLVMGDIFGTTIQNFYVNYSINGTTGNNIVNVSFFFDGVIINLTQFSGQQNVEGYFNYTFSDNNEHYMFVEAVQDNNKRAWSSPMYVTYSLQP